jgi:hypothetical protein
MGREALIAYEQVAAVCDAMKAAGSKPTLRSIREQLGNVGSMGTISRLMQEWKVGQERKIASAMTLPHALQGAILDFMGQELAAAKAILEAELAEQRQEVSDLATENERQTIEIEEKNKTIITLRAELASLQGRLGQMITDLTANKEEADRERQATETARIELAKTLLRLESLPRLESDLHATREELELERRGRIQAEQDAAVLQAKLEASLEKAAVAERAGQQAVQEAKVARDEAAELRGKLK